MLSKKTLDILTILLVIIFFASVFIGPRFFNNTIGGDGDVIASAASLQRSITLVWLPFQLCALAYYIIMLITAIQLYKKEKYSLGNTIVLAILPPFAFIFYLVSLRSAIKKDEAGN